MAGSGGPARCAGGGAARAGGTGTAVGGADGNREAAAAERGGERVNR